MAEIISFSRSLYEPAAVEAAAAAYGALGRFQVETRGDEIVVTIELGAGESADTYDEFCNHALFETVTRWQAGANEEPR